MKNLGRAYLVYMAVVELMILIYQIALLLGPFHERDLFEGADKDWADSVLKTMSPEEKTGQLFLFSGQANEQSDLETLKHTMSAIPFGGFVLTDCKSEYVEKLPRNAPEKAPYLLSISGLTDDSSALRLPPLTLAAACNDTALWRRYSDALSNFSVSLGENLHLDSPPLPRKASCSFGCLTDNPAFEPLFASQLAAFRSRRLLYTPSCFAHFRDFRTDTAAIAARDSLLYVYKHLTKNGLPILAIDPASALPFAAEERQLSRYLERNLGFEGLILTDISKHTIDIQKLVKLFDAGAHLFVTSREQMPLIEEFTALVRSGAVSMKALDRKVKRILLAKSWMNKHPRPNTLSRYPSDRQAYELLISRLHRKAICLALNRSQLLPLGNVSALSPVVVSVGNAEMPGFEDNMLYYVSRIRMLHTSTPDSAAKVLPVAGQKASPLILCLNQISVNESDTALIHTAQNLAKRKKLLVINFGAPSNLAFFPFAHGAIQCYDHTPFDYQWAAQAVFGGVALSGRMPCAVDTLYEARHGLISPKIRLAFTLPADVGIDAARLAEIDSVVWQAITERATPGCQVLAAKGGKVFYFKTFGRLAYMEPEPVQRNSIYDLASLTKVCATTLTLMKLWEARKYSLDDSIKHYLTDTLRSRIKNITFRQLLVHQSGLPPDMPIIPYMRRHDSTGVTLPFFSMRKDSTHTLEVAEDFWFDYRYLDTLWNAIDTLRGDSLKPYIYSDINFNILYRLIKPMLSQPLNDYVERNIYRPLGMHRTGYCPLQRFDEQQIAPTQNDTWWRRQLLRGYVHDPAAALYGGVAGSAGLFSTAGDLAVLFQMLLNDGQYGGKRIFSPETIALFTSTQPGSQRGLGFNKNSHGGFGHTGFTGTCAWADPKNGLVFVFLSNRVHPRQTNDLLQKSEVRGRILDILYQAQNTFNDE